MKALTILQPWASLIACGAKKIETRSWSTKYRGPIAIHAGQFLHSPWACELPNGLSELAGSVLWPEGNFSSLYDNWNELPRGSVIAVADLVDCVKITGNSFKYAILEQQSSPFNEYIISGNEIAFGDYTPGRYAWMLENIRMIEPIPAKGMQRLWNWWPLEIKMREV